MYMYTATPAANNPSLSHVRKLLVIGAIWAYTLGDQIIIVMSKSGDNRIPRHMANTVLGQFIALGLVHENKRF